MDLIDENDKLRSFNFFLKFTDHLRPRDWDWCTEQLWEAKRNQARTPGMARCLYSIIVTTILPLMLVSTVSSLWVTQSSILGMESLRQWRNRDRDVGMFTRMQISLSYQLKSGTRWSWSVPPKYIWYSLQAAAKIVSSTGVPHFINATNPRGRDIVWNTPDQLDSSTWSFSNWDEKSGQPNDCIVEETCVFIGPHGKVK